MGRRGAGAFSADAVPARPPMLPVPPCRAATAAALDAATAAACFEAAYVTFDSLSELGGLIENLFSPQVS